MRVLETRSTLKVHTSRKSREDDFGNGVAAANRILQDTQVTAVLDDIRDFWATPLDLITGHLQHLVSVLGASTESASAVANGLIAQVRRDEPILVLVLDGLLEKAVHELQRLLLIGEHSAAVDVLEVEVEVTFLETGIEHFLNLGGVLRKEESVVDGLHGPDRHLLALPFDSLRWVDLWSHDDGVRRNVHEGSLWCW